MLVEIVEEDMEDEADVDEAIQTRSKEKIIVPFTVDISGKIVFSTLMGTITGPGMVQEMEIARVEEMARGQTIPTMQITTRPGIMVAQHKTAKETAQITTILEMQPAGIAAIETTQKTRIITWPTWEHPIGLSID